jgi:hypothetical protein
MTQSTRRKIDAALKAKIALEALREQATVAGFFTAKPELRSLRLVSRKRITAGHADDVDDARPLQ